MENLNFDCLNAELEYSCFISYRHVHAKNVESRRVIDELLKNVQREIELLGGSCYLDRNRLNGSENISNAIASSICSSACMIMLFTPDYFKSDSMYCAREYIAMKNIHETRKQVVEDLKHDPNSPIITIVLRGENYLPTEITEKYMYFDFTSYAGADTFADESKEYFNLIKKIALLVYERYQTLLAYTNDICNECATFDLPTKVDAQIAVSNMELRKQKFREPA